VYLAVVEILAIKPKAPEVLACLVLVVADQEVADQVLPRHPSRRGSILSPLAEAVEEAVMLLPLALAAGVEQVTTKVLLEVTPAVVAEGPLEVTLVLWVWSSLNIKELKMKYAMFDSKNNVTHTFVPQEGFTIEESFTAEVVAMYSVIPEEVEAGWKRHQDGTFSAPTPETIPVASV
jgi:hypothetical protein